MGPLGVEFLHEGVKARLLLQAVHARRTSGLFLQGKVHAFVSAVLLRTAGLDAFDLDAQAQPPYREFGEVKQGIGAGKRYAVIRADRLG